MFLDFNRQTVKQIMGLCTDIVGQHNPEKLYFMLSSNGGEVVAGFTLYNFLVGLSTKVVMHNVGTVDSIATVVFLAGDERYASEHSTFLYHGVSFTVQGSMSFTLDQLEERVSSLKEDQERIAKIIADKTGLSLDQTKKYQRRGETLNPEKAKEAKIISQIREVTIPANVPLVNIVT